MYLLPTKRKAEENYGEAMSDAVRMDNKYYPKNIWWTFIGEACLQPKLSC